MSAARESTRRQAPRREPASGGALLANLAAQPFVNKRPVQRFAMAAWAIAAVLIGINVALYVNYRHESTSLRTRLAATRAEIETKSRHVVAMDEKLRGLRLGAQNAQVAFLNERIAERTFPWSLLFERIATTLPDGVRLKSLHPVFTEADDKTPVERELRKGKGKAKNDDAPPAPAPPPPEELVNLTLLGTAKSDEALYELVDALFASPSFASPRLHQESTNGGEVEFTVDVDYRPRYTPEAMSLPAVASDEETEAGEPADGAEPIIEESSNDEHRPAIATTEDGEDAEETDEVSE